MEACGQESPETNTGNEKGSEGKEGVVEEEHKAQFGTERA